MCPSFTESLSVYKRRKSLSKIINDPDDRWVRPSAPRARTRTLKGKHKLAQVLTFEGFRLYGDDSWLTENPFFSKLKWFVKKHT